MTLMQHVSKIVRKASTMRENNKWQGNEFRFLLYIFCDFLFCFRCLLDTSSTDKPFSIDATRSDIEPRLSASPINHGSYLLGFSQKVRNANRSQNRS